MYGSPFRPRPVPGPPPRDEGAAKVGGPAPPGESQDAMSGELPQPRVAHQVVITNAAGLHMRPATAFAELARLYQSSVAVLKDAKRVDGKSPLDMMLLAAEQGCALTVEAVGPDAAAAVQGLVELLVALGVVSETDLPSPRKDE